MTGLAYEDYLSTKRLAVPAAGFAPMPFVAPLFPFQQDIVRWAVQRGRAAIFADTGLGKTRMMYEWARQVCAHTGGDVLILAPLAVTSQSVAEGVSIGIPSAYRRRQDAVTPGITVANYDVLDALDLSHFAGVVLDESSILKSLDGKTRNALIERAAAVPYRLANTATPAPNDHTELGNHAEFLGVMKRSEMLATFFVHDGGDTQSWRLKGHAEDEFWRWVCSWALAVRSPADLGHDDTGYALPSLNITSHVVHVEPPDPREQGLLFAMPARTLIEQRRAKRTSITPRVDRAAEIIRTEPNEQWLVWCELNDEADALTRALPGATEIRGNDTPHAKADRMLAFARREIPILVSKSSICGFGMNWQQCARQLFVGVNHSYESMYQAIRRCWRFGQTRAVQVHVVASDLETEVLASLRRKEADHVRMSSAMIGAMRETQIAHVRGQRRDVVAYLPRVEMQVPAWLRTEVEAA